jgi:two-component system response regulator RegA
MKSILLVDDEDFFRQRLVKAFSKRGYTVFSAANFDEAISEIKENKPEMAVVDLKMPGRSGLEIIKAGQNLHPEMSIVVLTGYGSIATATEAIRLGAINYLPKPADVDDILNAFSRNDALNIDINQEKLVPPSLARLEWEHINRVLTECDSNISAAAKKLGIHRRTLQRKLYKYPPTE